ncbi:uncharacterized protein VP01_12g6 [Puccinia sorghi]|uniref:Scavenger mRNA-decapping enzyme DcpS n=1 Tax=Puccinia sorghi TaxID=27349 RepID=A0A0L6VPV9_9BASI|nr:uncharacterized protein VP01_12g6 [Puccinia sorghi]
MTGLRQKNQTTPDKHGVSGEQRGESSGGAVATVQVGQGDQRRCVRNPSHHTVNLLGTIERVGDDDNDDRTGKAIIILNKTHFPTQPEILASIHSPQHITHTKAIGQNDVYLWALAWLNPIRPAVENSPDLKLQIIFPATQLVTSASTPNRPSRSSGKHRSCTSKLSCPTSKASRQRDYPGSLYNILDHVTEADKIVYEEPSDTDGFMIMPDLKWDQSTLSSLYLLCIVKNRGIQSLRDLRPSHLGMLQGIRARGSAAIENKYKVCARELRMFVHYQPSYYHFHVHITHVNHIGFHGITVGQAHLLDEVIDNLAQELQITSSGPSFYEAKTLTYALGSNHDLFEPLWARQQLE